MTKREWIDYCLTLSAAYEDYPFGYEWAVMRHQANKKALLSFMSMMGGYEST